jgi:uncharacterized membrane protein YeaQ/YmgE (transglycosylase-associated protein family)
MAQRRMQRERCAVHPARPAVDRCPVCDRPRCGADAVGAGCRACRGLPEVANLVSPPAADDERLVRAALAAYAVALPAGVVASEYVDSPVFSYVFPFVVGVVTGWAATAAARTDGRGRLGTRVRTIGAVLGVLGVALGFLLEKSLDPVSADVHVLLPYVAAVAGAVLWTSPPRPRRLPDQDAGTEA